MPVESAAGRFRRMPVFNVSPGTGSEFAAPIRPMSRPGDLKRNKIPQGHIPIPPDLAVEVISPNDIYQDVEAKAEEYLDAGVRLVWVLNPNNRTVRVFSTENRLSIQLGPNDDLSGGSVLPGFTCRIADLFPPQT